MRSDNPVQPKIKQTYTVQLILIQLMMLIMQLIDFQSDCVKANTPTVYVNQLKLILYWNSFMNWNCVMTGSSIKICINNTKILCKRKRHAYMMIAKMKEVKAMYQNLVSCLTA